MEIVRSELYCHNCNKYIQFTYPSDRNGNLTVNCPACNHPHFRVVENGRITGERWGSSNGGGSLTAITTTSSASSLMPTNQFSAAYTFWSGGTNDWSSAT